MPRIDCFDIIKNNPELVSEFISITEDMPEVEQRKQAIQIVNKLLEASNESLNKVKRKVGQKPQKYNSGVSQDAIDEIIKKYSQPEQKETPQAESTPALRDVESIAKKSDADIEKRMLELQDSGLKIGTPETKEFNALEKEMEKRERDSVFNVPLDKVGESVDALMQKEKDMPNGFGAFIEKRDARETKEVADKYLNAKELTDAELKKDFSDAVRGNPTTWYADGLKMREALKEATNRGIDTKDMLAAVTKVYEDAGYDTETAKSVVANMLKPIFEGSQKVETNESKLVKSESLLSKEQTPQAGSGDVGGEQPLKETPNEGKVNLSTSAPKQSITKKAFTALTTMLKKAFPKVEFIGEKEAREIMGGSDKPSYQITMPDGSKKEVQPINDDVINGFYSPLEKIISETKFDKLPAKQWIDKFAKGEEAKWTGLTDWLNQQQGSVSKADIQQYLKDNRISFVEVVKGGIGNMSKADAKKVFEDNGYDVITDRNGDTYIEKNEEVFDYNDMSELEQNAFDILTSNNLDRVNTANDTKFGNRPELQLEGEKENYKEVLVTMPKKKVKVDGFEISETDTVIYEDRGMGKPLKVIKVIPKKFTEASSEANKYISDNSYKHEYNLDYNDGESVIDALKKGGVKIDETNFESSHYDEPNILVHLRMNTRTDADGNKVLFLEEIQSDWGQTGKKEGFENPAYSVKLSDKEIDGLKLYDILMDGKPLADIDTRDLAKWYENKYREKLYPRNASENQANKVAERLNEALTEGKVPSAPFVTDTNAWTKLGLKVALKEAVKQGATKIAWTTGEQQNERYDLSKQVKDIQYNKNSIDDSFNIVVKGINGEKLYSNEAALPSEIEATLGKDILTKMQNNEGENVIGKVNVLKGENLKVGGKGMKGFYGSPTEGSLGIVGNVAKSLTKQEVGTVEIENGSNRQAKYIGESPTLEDLEKVKAVAIKGGSDIYISPITGDKQMFPVNRTANSTPLVNAIREVRNGKDVITAMKENGVDPELFGGKWEEQSKSSTQHSIDITPELKAQVEQGLPLFMRTAKGEVFGFQQGSKIFIDPSLINADTPIHEVVGHYGMNIIDAMAKGGDEKAQAIIAKGFSLLQAPEGKAVLDEIKANPAYSNLSLREKKMEALATIIGREGANMFAEGTRKNTFASKVKDFIKSFYDYIRTKVPTLKDKTIKQIVAMDNKEFIRAIVGDAFRGEIVQQNNESLSDDKVMLQAQKEADSITLKYNGKGQHLAPNGKPSNLTEQQAKIVRTEAFKNWFGDWENDPKNASKVVDANGEPLVVYHGTEGVFNEFDRELGSSNSGLKEFGNYFTDNKELAKVYGGSLKEVFLNIRYLPEFDAKGETFEKGWRELEVDAGYKIANNRDAMEFIRYGKFGVKKAEGVKAKNIIDLTFYRPPTESEKEKFIGNTYLVFDEYANQIKLADGTNTTFNPNTNDIRFQASPKTDLQEAERKLKEAWGKYLSNGISFDGMAEAEKERQLIVALLGYLKAKGIDIAKGIGNEVRDFIKNKFSGVTDEMIDVAQGRMLTDYQKLYDTHMTPKNKEILDGMVSQVKSGEMSFEDFINTIDGIVPNERIKNVFISYVNEQIDPLDGYVAVDEEIEESPESPKAETSKEEERAFIGGLLARPINRKNFPNIVGDNKTDDDVLKRITAVTQEDVQDRKVMVDTSYVRVALENIKEIALQNANALYMQFGEDWQNKVMDYLSDYLNAANPAQAIGILNVISTDVQQKIEKSQSPTERTKLFKLQDKADELSILFASQASLGINARKILRQFAQGGNMSKLVLDKILTEDTMQTIEEINRIAASKPTNEELNNATLPVQAPQTPKSRIQKIKQNVKAALSSKQKNKPKITEQEINELGRRAEEERKRQGVQTKMSRQQIAQMLKEEAKKC
jgi:hypothetical protein